MPHSKHETLTAREDRLPKWAKEDLRRLRRELDLALSELHAHRLNAYGPEDTNTYAEPYSDQPINLPRGTTVEFLLGDRHEDEIRVRVSKDGLDVNGNGGLIVYPRASNSIIIRGGRL